MSALPTPISRALGDVASEAELRDGWQSVQQRRAAPPSRPWWLLAPAFALASLLAWMSWPAAASPILARTDGAPMDAVTAPIALTDGSHVTPLEGGALRVLENQAGVLALHLERGAARFEVTPGTGRRWRVEADGVVVEVVGTVFTVDRRDGVRVSVERGAVVVRGEGVPDGVRRLGAGDALHVDRSPVAAAPEPVVEAPVAPPITEVVPSTPPARHIAAPPTAAALMAEADAARAAGRDEDAVPILDRIAREHLEAPEAAVAAFTAARIVARHGDRAGAEERFRAALALGLPPALEEEAQRALGEHPATP